MSRNVSLTFCLLLLLALVCVNGHSKAGGCGFSRLKSRTPAVVGEDEAQFADSIHLHESGTAQTQYEPIRIYFDFYEVERADANILHYVRTKYTQSCGNYFKTTLKVAPVQGPIKVNGVECETNNPLLIQKGIEGYDLVIVVKFEFAPAEDFVAAATFCQLDARHLYRPTAGIMYINTAHLRPWSEADWTSHFTTCIHELTHVMAMNPPLFDFFVDKNGKRLGYSNVVKRGNYGGVNVDLIVLEPLRSRARQYFNCPDLPGFALEANNTKPSVPNGHFNPNWVLNEIMAPRDNDGVVVSEFFFALFESTGWYIPDYRYAEFSTFGRGLGCPYLIDACRSMNKGILRTGMPMKPFYYEFCVNEGDMGCTADYLYKGVCIEDPMSEPCKYYLMDPPSACFKAIPVQQARGEYTSVESKCVLGTLHRFRPNDKFTGRCYKTICEKKQGTTIVKVIIGNDEETLECNASNIAVPSTKFKGYIVCPNIQVVCRNRLQGCRNECSFKGVCVEGKCVCHLGYAGADCSRKADWQRSGYDTPLLPSRSIFDTSDTSSPSTLGHVTYSDPDLEDAQKLEAEDVPTIFPNAEKTFNFGHFSFMRAINQSLLNVSRA